MPTKRKKTADESLAASQIRFCQYVFEHGNATRAFREAGLTAKSEGAARKAASWLLSKRKVQSYIGKLRRRVLNEYANARRQNTARFTGRHISHTLTKDKEG